MKWIHAAFARSRLLFARTKSDERFSQEIAFHIEMETERLQREHALDAPEARRQAMIAFGGVEQYKEEMRAARGLRWVGGLALDLKLGLRMLARWPGLTVVGVAGMAVAVAVGTFTYGMVDNLVGPTIPIDDGHRVVMIENWDARSSRQRGETHLHDARAWRESLRAIREFGAYRLVKRNLLVPDAQPEPLQIAEMTASGFDIARVAPVKGRYLLHEDEAAGAQPVVVISEDVWRSRFASADDIIGRSMRIGNRTHTIVGVMPASFRFPVNNRIWMPLQLDPLLYAEGDAPAIKVFGRLHDGASIGEARAQAEAVAARLNASRPVALRRGSHERDRVRPFLRRRTNVGRGRIQSIKVAVSLLLVVIGINVAVLVFARTAGRMGEIAVRTALGASRARIVAQLFAEALVLSLISAIVGLVAAAYALRYLGTAIDRLGGEFLPYWLNFHITWGMVLYGFGMALLAAFLVGAIPALKATGPAVRANLQSLGGGGGIRLGRAWTVLIVAQVAVAVALLPAVVHFAIVKPAMERVEGPAFDTSAWITTHVVLDRAQPASARAMVDSVARQTFATRTSELITRLRAESSVADVVLLSAVPGAEPIVSIHTDSVASAMKGSDGLIASTGVYNIASIQVEPSFFESFGIPLLGGRSLDARDAGEVDGSASSVVVNQPFVEKVFGGGSVIGRRIRLAAVNGQDLGDWLEIVGVVPNFPSGSGLPTAHPVMYRALSRDIAQPIVMAVRARGVQASSITGRLREVALSIDPMMRLEDVRLLDDSESIEDVLDRVIYSGVMMVTLSIVLLAAAGIYALMSFTIARRRREIGIRAALGAGARQIVSGVLARAARQVGLGIVIGLAFASLLVQTADSWRWNTTGMISLGSVALFMLLVGIAAAWGPAREALRIQPNEALRSE